MTLTFCTFLNLTNNWTTLAWHLTAPLLYVYRAHERQHVQRRIPTTLFCQTFSNSTNDKQEEITQNFLCIVWSIQYGYLNHRWHDLTCLSLKFSEGFQLFSQHLSTPETRESLHQADKFPNCAWEKSRRKLWLMAPFERGVGHQGSSFEKRSTESGNPCPKRNATSPALQAAKHPRTRNAGCNSSKRVLPSHEDKIQIGSWIIVLFLKKRIPKCPSASLDSSLSHLSSHSWLMAGWQVKSVKSVISRTCNWTLTFGKNF